MTYYKVLENGRSCHGGKLKWSLPTKDGESWNPGKWHSVRGEITMCEKGIHLTKDPYAWYTWDCEVRHTQQAIYSTFHDCLTQVCYGYQKVRSNLRLLKEEK